MSLATMSSKVFSSMLSTELKWPCLSESLGSGPMHGTGAAALVAQPAGGYEVDQLQDLLHGDLVAKYVEVDPGHGRRSFARMGRWKQDRSVPAYI